MTKISEPGAAPRLLLLARTAADLMTPNPVSIRDTATVAEAVALLTAKGISGAPVIDEAGRPIGVVSRADIIVHDRERLWPGGSETDSGRASAFASRPEPSGSGAHSGMASPTLVRDVMTPAVFSVTPQTPASQVITELLALKVHRLFVVENNQVLVGVISARDVLRHLQLEPGPAA